MLSNTTSIEKVYLFCAIVGGGIFILRAVLMLIGFGGDEDAAGNFDASDTSPADDFKMVSIHSLTAFFLMFGMVGFVTLQNYPENQIAAVIAAIISGVVAMLAIAKIFQYTKKLTNDGTIQQEDAIGAEGSVYLTIKPGEIGKVQIVARGALKVFDARAKEPDSTIKTGERIKVIGNADVLIVEKQN